MEKIDWTKPIRLVDSRKPAKLVYKLAGNQSHPYVTVWEVNGYGDEVAEMCSEDGFRYIPGMTTAYPFIENVPPAPLVLYGRLEPFSPGNCEGMGWTPHKGGSDTHCMVIPGDLIHQFIKPIGESRE